MNAIPILWVRSTDYNPDQNLIRFRFRDFRIDDVDSTIRFYDCFFHDDGSSSNSSRFYSDCNSRDIEIIVIRSTKQNFIWGKPNCSDDSTYLIPNHHELYIAVPVSITTIFLRYHPISNTIFNPRQSTLPLAVKVSYKTIVAVITWKY